MADDINFLPPDGRARPAQERDVRAPNDADTKLHVPPLVPQEKERMFSVSGNVSAIQTAPRAADAPVAPSLLDQKVEPIPTAVSPKAAVIQPSVARPRLSRPQKWLLFGGVLLTAVLAGLTVYLFWSL